jgi:hypothetical protein
VTPQGSQVQCIVDVQQDDTQLAAAIAVTPVSVGVDASNWQVREIERGRGGTVISLDM